MIERQNAGSLGGLKIEVSDDVEGLPYGYVAIMRDGKLFAMVQQDDIFDADGNSFDWSDV